MRLKLFKMFESRTSELTESEFRKILHEKCKDFVKNPKLLQRSKIKSSSQFTYIDPKQYERNQLTTGNTDGVDTKHHIILMDNLPSWSEFPKRSKSVIGLTSEDPRTIFGSERFLIIPFDGARFGVAPSCDLWGCNSVGLTSISFNNRFSELMKADKISDNSYSEMISDLQRKYDEWLKSNGDQTKTRIRKIEKIFFKFKEKEFKNVEDALSYFLSPIKFKGSSVDDMQGFNVMNYSELTSLDEYDFYEFWTDSECLLFYLGKLNTGSDIETAYNQFVNNFIK